MIAQSCAGRCYLRSASSSGQPGLRHAICRLASLLLFLASITGCATVAMEDGNGESESRSALPEASQEVPGVSSDVAATLLEASGRAEVRPASFSKDTLYGLLVAELALRQGDLATALGHYVAQARATRDRGVVAQAVRLAVLARDAPAGREMAELWAALAPQEPRARQAAALALIRVGDLQGALGHLAELRAQTGTANFGYLAAEAADLDESARADLSKALTALHERFPHDLQLAYARALLLEQLDHPQQALAVLEGPAEEALPREAVLLQSDLLARLGRLDEAIAVLDGRLAVPALADSDAARLRYARARRLIDAGRFAAAQEDFEALLAQVGESPQILLSLALLALDQQEYPRARDYLERLLATGRRRDVAYHYLGEIARAEGDVESAVAAFGEVAPGAHFDDAQVRASALLLRHSGREELARYLAMQRARYPDEAVTLWLLESALLFEAAAEEAAIDVLDEAIVAHPDDLELRYARALARERSGDIAGLEVDLRHMLALDPDHAMALNALGYILADRTDRFAEAKALIVRALALRPDEAAFLDSLGWVEYRLGNHERARALLTRAYGLMPDHELAAHLGEVLWVMGDREAAVEVWEAGLAVEPDSGVLAETMGRLLGGKPALSVRSDDGDAPRGGE